MGREQNYNVKPRSTVRTVTGSKRHVSKTHGSHNGRTSTWPHPSDAIERPEKLPDLDGVRRDEVARGRKHGKARHPMRMIAKTHYQDGAKDIPRLPSWRVTGHRVYDHCIVDVTLCAQSEAEAIENGEYILRYSHMCIIIDIEAERANT